MIGLVYGTVDSIRPPYVIVDTGSGTGYKILIPQSLISKTHTGEKIRVYTYTHVREDILELFGFESQNDLALFELFLSVPGIGPKTAVGVFSVGTASQIRGAILSSDLAFFGQVPRLGKKNAQKIILELKSKIGGDDTFDLSEHQDESELISALKDFGFKPAEISETLKKIRGEATTLEEKMRLALKHLGK